MFQERFIGGKKSARNEDSTKQDPRRLAVRGVAGDGNDGERERVAADAGGPRRGED